MFQFLKFEQRNLCHAKILFQASKLSRGMCKQIRAHSNERNESTQIYLERKV